jgi:hypothetical protein
MYGRINKIIENSPPEFYNVTWVYSHDKRDFTTTYSEHSLQEILKGWTMNHNLTIKKSVCLPEDLFTL